MADEPPGPSVLASLPSTRPARRSPKRAAAPPRPRKATRPAPQQPPHAPRPTRPSGPPRRPAIPPQGYAATPSPRSVDPPGRVDLVSATLAGAGDLVEIGLEAARHVVRALLRR